MNYVRVHTEKGAGALRLDSNAVLVVILALALSACSSDAGGGFEFALIGDNPYGADFIPKFENLIEHVNRQTDLTWVIHLGDVKGTEPCSDELLQSRFDLYQRFAHPFIYTPGDNDWYDCIEARMGSYDEYDRLDFIRKRYFPDPHRATAGGSLAVDPQSDAGNFAEFVENVMWVKEDIVFATVHLVRTSRAPTDQTVADRRLTAALAWIRRAFAHADEIGARGVFLAMQANPWFVSGLPQVVQAMPCPRCLAPGPGLDALYPELVRESLAFQRPVVLAVGDTHIFRVDKPLYDPSTNRIVENFTRVEVFGHPDVHWVRVIVDPNVSEVFTFRQELVGSNLRTADEGRGAN